jgi:hypothetical protein
MIRNLLALTAATTMAASPCLAADLPAMQDSGARRSGAAAGVYFRVPLSGKRSGKAQAGMRLQTVHDYRNAGAPEAKLIQADAFDLRLIGDRHSTLYVAGQPVTGEKARSNLGPVGSVVTIAFLVAAAVGGYYIWRAIDDSGDE